MKNKNQKENENIEKIEENKYDLIGNIFLGSMLDISPDLDNPGQNLAMYMEVEQLKDLLKKDK